ncbi:hypothetical protein EIJ81_00750 (plasmid) [Aliivibrio salmonicida]|uniref:hypothetical protein n=1 Tax=Aliivibrio salmonicida TaxID=40269 RepID=UPI000F6F316F|nr:hypothetical protein [Aliivibrio salmonicida]AZL83428.1 hypothetical protein EIJ81_00750 [Aliivibrio salmonicida]
MTINVMIIPSFGYQSLQEKENNNVGIASNMFTSDEFSKLYQSSINTYDLVYLYDPHFGIIPPTSIVGYYEAKSDVGLKNIIQNPFDVARSIVGTLPTELICKEIQLTYHKKIPEILVPFLNKINEDINAILLNKFNTLMTYGLPNHQ